jgi:ATP-binding cassette subfamily C protein CydC
VSDVRRLLRLVLPHWHWLAAGVLFGVIATGSNVALMGLSAYLISKAAIATSVAELALAITGVRVLAISRAGFRYIERYTTHRAMFRILSSVRVWFYRAVEPLAPARLVHQRSGDLLARSVGDVDALEDFYIKVVVPPVVAAVVVAAVSIIYGLFDPAIGLALAFFLVLTGVVLPLTARWLSRVPAGTVAAARGDVNAMLVDELQGVADLVALDAAAAHRARLLARARELDEARGRLGVIEGVSNALAGLFASLAGLVILVLAIPLVNAGELEGVFLAALPLAAIASFEAVQPLARSLQLFDTSKASARRLFELIDSDPPVVDPVSAAEPPSGHELTVEGLSFRFDESEPWVLRDLDLRLGAAERVALVGPSGCGKSTLVSLLLRFWAYDIGSIRLGGRELRELDQDDVRALLGVVPQDVHLFNATIEDNLLVADAHASREDLERACRIAQLDGFIDSLPDGFETVVGEDGLLLSGGEGRRLAVARAVLKDAPLVILDEATADLDSTTEAALWSALDRWLEGRTVLVISHRPTVAAHVDRVVELETTAPPATPA